MLGNWLAMKKDFSLLLGFLENFKYLKNNNCKYASK
jgi:hypothetical protein